MKCLSFILALLFIQFSLSLCWSYCNCSPPSTYEVRYTDLDLKILNTTGFWPKEVQDTIHKRELGINILVQFDEKEIATWDLNVSPKYIWLPTLMACSCSPNTYIYVDDINDLKIWVQDVKNVQQTNPIDITANFKASYGAELISIAAEMEARWEGDNTFSIELTETKTIPSSAIFIIEIYLKSGARVSGETQQINFYK